MQIMRRIYWEMNKKLINRKNIQIMNMKMKHRLKLLNLKNKQMIITIKKTIMKMIMKKNLIIMLRKKIVSFHNRPIKIKIKIKETNNSKVQRYQINQGLKE